MVDLHGASWRSEAQRSLSGAVDVALTAASCVFVVLTVVHHRASTTRRRRRHVVSDDTLNGSDDSAYDDSVYESNEADKAERASLVSTESSMALPDLEKSDGTTGMVLSMNKKHATTNYSFPPSKALYLVDVALYTTIAWGVMFVGHDFLCGAVMRCQCTFPWMGGWSRCNAHNLNSGPRCPWCTAPYWTSVLTQKSCAMAMVTAYALGMGGNSSESAVDAGTTDTNSSQELTCLPSSDKLDETQRAEKKYSTPLVTSLAFVVRRVALVVSKTFHSTDCDATSETEQRTGLFTKAHLRRLVTPVLLWFTVEMGWQLFFFLLLGTQQDPVYPCFVVCWGDAVGAFGNNPPSPLSMADAPPMARLGQDLGFA